jgi:hypothetical protein
MRNSRLMLRRPILAPVAADVRTNERPPTKPEVFLHTIYHQPSAWPTLSSSTMARMSGGRLVSSAIGSFNCCGRFPL